MQLAVALVALAAGLVAGTLYGRSVEQKIVGEAFREFGLAQKLSIQVMAGMHARLTYLRKYLGSQISG
jgi:hypothetical protein